MDGICLSSWVLKRSGYDYQVVGGSLRSWRPGGAQGPEGRGLKAKFLGPVSGPVCEATEDSHGFPVPPAYLGVNGTVGPSQAALSGPAF